MTDEARPHQAEKPIEGWKAIADAVRVSHAQVRRLAYRRRDPLPVWKFIGRVVAFPSALRDWAARQMLPLQVADLLEEPQPPAPRPLLSTNDDPDDGKSQKPS